MSNVIQLFGDSTPVTPEQAEVGESIIMISKLPSVPDFDPFAAVHVLRNCIADIKDDIPKESCAVLVGITATILNHAFDEVSKTGGEL